MQFCNVYAAAATAAAAKASSKPRRRRSGQAGRSRRMLKFIPAEAGNPILEEKDTGGSSDGVRVASKVGCRWRCRRLHPPPPPPPKGRGQATTQAKGCAGDPHPQRKAVGEDPTFRRSSKRSVAAAAHGDGRLQDVHRARRLSISDASDVVTSIAGADESIIEVLRTWRYKPQQIPVCFIPEPAVCVRVIRTENSQSRAASAEKWCLQG